MAELWSEWEYNDAGSRLPEPIIPTFAFLLMHIRRTLNLLVPAALFSFALPGMASAQSGKWTGTVSQLSIRGSADITVEPRNEKQSKVKISFRNTANDRPLAWDIAEGRCGQEGASIASLATFRQVRTGLDGQGEATSNVPLLTPGKMYYVRVFDPGEQPRDSGALGCANLSEKP